MSVSVHSQPEVPTHEPTSHIDHPTISLESVIRQWKIPASIWSPKCQPCVDQVIKEVDGYFLEHWDFPTEKSKKVFVAAGFSRVTALYFPMAKDDRIHFACRLLTVLFLIDDLLEDMSFEAGEAYNQNLINLSRGDVLPDRKYNIFHLKIMEWSLNPSN